MRSHHISAVVEPYCLINSLFGDPSTHRVTARASDNNNTNDGYLCNSKRRERLKPRVIRIPGGLPAPSIKHCCWPRYSCRIYYIGKKHTMCPVIVASHLNLQTNKGVRPSSPPGECLPCVCHGRGAQVAGMAIELVTCLTV